MCLCACKFIVHKELKTTLYCGASDTEASSPIYKTLLFSLKIHILCLLEVMLYSQLSYI